MTLSNISKTLPYSSLACLARTCRFFSTASGISPYPIPVLPTLEAITRVAEVHPKIKQALAGKQLIGVQHNLETTASIYQKFIQAFGMSPDDMHVMGKCYSSNKAIKATIKQLGIKLYDDPIPDKPQDYAKLYNKMIRAMWMELVKAWQANTFTGAIVLDDGGRLPEAMPFQAKFEGVPLALVEQTRGGFYSPALEHSLFPGVSVGTCVAKQEGESRHIATAILLALDELLTEASEVLSPEKLGGKPVFGVYGNGAIGMAIVKHLLSKGYRVLVYDADPETKSAFSELSDQDVYRVETKREFFGNVHCVLGCTGRDITEGANVLQLIPPGREIVFASCTSENKEFFTLLKQMYSRLQRRGCPPADPLGTISYTTPSGGAVHVLRGGYPLNFDRKPWNVPAKDIELTQGLLVGAVLQASLIARPLRRGGVLVNRSTLHCLDPYVQRFMIRCLAADPERRYHYNDDFFAQFEDINWIIERSGGEYYPNDILKAAFEAAPVFTPILQLEGEKRPLMRPGALSQG